MNRVPPHRTPIDGRTPRALAAALLILALLPLLTRGADATESNRGPTIDVTMDSWPDAIWEPGRKAAFGIEVTNTSPEPVTITAATESLDGSPDFDLSAVHGPVLHTTCKNAVGTVLTPGDSYTCNFIVYVGGDVGDVLTETATITVQDDEGNTTSSHADQSYEILDSHPTIDVTKSTDPTSVTEPGADVTSTVSATNTSPEPARIVAVLDSIAGTTPFDVTQVGGPVLATTCKDAPATILAPGDTYTCAFTLHVAGDAGDVVDDAVAFVVADDEQNEVTGTAGSRVEIGDATPTIEVDKTTTVASVAAPGADVPFTLEVTNTSVEDTTITAVTDQVGADDLIDVTSPADPVVSTTCGDAIGTTLAPGGTYTCEFTLHVAGVGAGSVTDTVRVTAVDNEENTGTGEDDETVQVTLPVAEPGAEPTAPAAVTPVPPAPTTPAAQVGPATQAPAAIPATAPAARASAAPLLAVTGQEATTYVVIALLLLVAGATLVGYSQGRRAARLDG